MPPYNCNCDPKFLNDFSPDIEVLPKNCPAVWDLVCEGNTKGCFQLESNLGKSLAKECLPRNIDELAALVSIMRPGCLEAMREGKSITKHYIDRKNGKEEVTYYHSALENILSDTYGEMIYQEGALRIARDIAGFSLQEADTLRKAVGKKLADVMAKVKKQFIKGCKKQGIVNEKEAKDIFSWIEKSQRYNFNKSHGVSYAENGYLSAYIKTHYPYEFFTGWLTFAYGKPKPREELYELIQNARAMEIEVLGPDLRKLNDGFELIDNKIYFGLSSIKNVGVAVLKKIHYVIEEIGTPVQEWKWIDFVLSFRPKITSTAVQSLIESGAVQYLGNNRTRMCYECKVCAQLTKKELDWIRLRKKETLEECLVELLASPTGKGGGIANKRRWPAVQDLLHSLQSPPLPIGGYRNVACWSGAKFIRRCANLFYS